MSTTPRHHALTMPAVAALLAERIADLTSELVVPPTPSRYDRRTVTLLFPTIAAALAAKRDMEGVEPGSRASTP